MPADQMVVVISNSGFIKRGQALGFDFTIETMFQKHNEVSINTLFLNRGYLFLSLLENCAGVAKGRSWKPHNTEIHKKLSQSKLPSPVHDLAMNDF
ncbi:MAG: hypothetical protein ACK5X3_21120 [Pseudomonadota bacterium]